MRIIAGYLGGRTFVSPGGHRTHPMSDKVRGAIFGVLGDIKGLTVLDVFAGSGALAFEAISRGAKRALVIEVDKRAHTVIAENIKALGVDNRVKAVRAFAGAWSTRHQAELFDLVFVDPPYDNIPYRDLKSLPRHLADGGTLILSWPGKAEPLKFVGLKAVQAKDYGDAQLVFYQKVS
ncbi:MAG TPA: 16S rRNA (guanine(966)-N(2))-methyltransferase RsmD [Verrucomicrobiae bacterium]|jgi:16S rRNA (guanine966-N2)-methyltransferase|nr:16S rRNA (guanine(966)-N(2))-methyltransferase RsmD [Verrucomicrobiae bacterium]